MGLNGVTLLIVVRMNYSTTVEATVTSRKIPHKYNLSPERSRVLNQGQLAKSGDFNWGTGRVMTSIWWVDTRDDAQHPTQAQESAHNKELFSQKCQCTG